MQGKTAPTAFAATATPAWLSAPLRKFRTRPYLYVAGLFAAYTTAFIPIHMTIGPPVGALAILLSVAAGFLLPRVGGLIFAVLFAAANWMLFSRFTPFAWGFHLGGSAAVFVACFGGVAARRAWDQLQRQRRELKAAHRQLLETQAMLVQSAKLASLGELAAGVGHELNQPLQIIRLAAEAARRPMTPQAQGQLQDQLDTIVAQTRRAAAIITQLRTLGRTADPACRTMADINAVVRDTLLLFTSRWQEANIQVQVDLPDHLPGVQCNAAQIEEALLNVVLNATQALQDQPDRRIAIRTFAHNGSVCIAVQDSGGGIPEGVIDRIFDPFFTTKPVGEGRGLGLAVSYRILADHGGAIRVESPAGAGATFQLCLPAAEALRVTA